MGIYGKISSREVVLTTLEYVRFATVEDMPNMRFTNPVWPVGWADSFIIPLTGWKKLDVPLAVTLYWT